jgi:hypothetical protein
LSSLPPSGFNLGAASSRIAFMSVAASVHSRWACSPINGQFLTDSAGMGISETSEPNSFRANSALPIRPNPSHVTGPMTIIRHNKVTSAAASRRLSSRRASQSNSG